MTLTIPADTLGGAYLILAAADADDLLVETQEGNNTLARLVQIGPDLMVTSMTVPATATAGAPVTVTDTTLNAGAGAAGATTTRYYFSTNPVLDSADVEIGSRALPALAAAASHTGSATVTIPAGTAPGTYYVVAKVDADGVVGETQEGNNTFSRSVQLGPDLVIAGLTAPPSAGAGTPLTVTDTTLNTGGGPATATTTSFYLSANTTVDAGDTLLGSRSIPALAAGASHTGSVTVTVPAGTAPGTYFLLAQADAGQAVAETSETNNVASRTLQVGPDLMVTSLTLPATAVAGAPLTVTDTALNAGAGAAGATTTRYYFSTNPVLDGADVELGSRAVPALAAGAAHTGSATVTIPAGTAAGTYYVVARVDADGVVAETQEGNNTFARSVQLGPDLLISGLTAPP
ncbi:MAG TPA: CARDB domain-containing protein, partial [Methylomirabilota bacterium]|nr:CARDB domain-containing protein [Methylomirabilota bacterium]